MSAQIDRGQFVEHKETDENLSVVFVVVKICWLLEGRVCFFVCFSSHFCEYFKSYLRNDQIIMCFLLFFL